MRTDHVDTARPTASGGGPLRHRPGAGPMAVLIAAASLALLLGLAGGMSVIHSGDDSTAIVSRGSSRTAEALAEGSTNTIPSTSTESPAPAGRGSTKGLGSPSSTTAPAGRTRPASSRGPGSTPPATAAAVVPTTVTAAPVIQPGGTPAATTVTTASPCRNSTDPACGPFRFDPQPGPDRPMTVEVGAEPPSPAPGQPMVFHVVLRDPDGVSHGASQYGFGDSGIGDASSADCKRFGPWDPPAPDPAHAIEDLDVGHTYLQPGTYTATFSFEAGPFECVDSVSGRGDRPYASGATASVTVVVK